MDAHFRVLGLARGCDEEALRKAYRQRALTYHPDRNPQGAEEFKRVQTAYEAITQHLKLHGGRDVLRPAQSTGPYKGSSHSDNSHSSGGAAFRYARRQRQTNNRDETAFDDTPLFTEEELFGGDAVPGGFASEARRASRGCGRGGGRGGASRPAGYAHTSAHHAADEHWRRAHGARVPVSGYDAASDAIPPRYQGSREGVGHRGSTDGDQDNFAELYKAYLAKGYGTGRPFAPTSTFAASHETNDGDDDEEGADASQDKTRAMWRDLDHLQSTEAKQAALRASWEALQRNIGLKMTQQQQARDKQKQEPSSNQREADDTDTTYATVERQMAAQAEAARRDWQAKKDAARRQEEEAREASRRRAAEAILQRHEEAQRRQAAIDAAQAQRAAASDRHMDEIHDERRQLTRQLFYHKYMPDAAEVGDMTDAQVCILSELLQQTHARVERVLEARLARGPCSRCQGQPKCTTKHVFTCTHACVCEACTEVAKLCPLCGAARTSAGTPTTDAPRCPSPSLSTHGLDEPHTHEDDPAVVVGPKDSTVAAAAAAAV